MEYPKMNSLWKRCFTEIDPVTGKVRYLDKGKSGNPFIRGEYSETAFGNIRKWHVEEKIDGMNIRIIYQRKPQNAQEGPWEALQFKGRTDAAQIPPDLLKALKRAFPCEKLESAFSEGDPAYVVLFGEGYGPKIQSGGYYAKEPGFVLFDIFCGGWWLERSAVTQIGATLQTDTAPSIGIMEEGEIVEYVKGRPASKFAKVIPHHSEGVVCRAHPLVLFRNGQPLMWKLKVKDFI